MDFHFLPEIFALLLLILGFRPLVRRVGAHTNLWFLGWAFLLLHYLVLSFHSAAVTHMTTSLLALWSLNLGVLAFILAISKTSKPFLQESLIAAMMVPIVLESAVSVLPAPSRGLELAVSALFLLPGATVLVTGRRRSREETMVGIGFGLFGLLILPLALRRSTLIESGSLALLLVTASYLFIRSKRTFSKASVAAALGMMTWGMGYPIAALYQASHPGSPVPYSFIELPQYLMVAGIVLMLLEEHVLRTERMAMHDPLTDLPNRRLFEERLVATMEEARLNKTTVACLVIDVDNFKTINDTLGHTAGDQLLRALSVRLAWHMSPRDILARTGGDEFTALLAGVTDEHHLRFIAGAMMSAASVPVAIDGMSVDVRISIGIALSPDHAEDIDSLRRAADEAMYAAKRKGGSLLAFAGES